VPRRASSLSKQKLNCRRNNSALFLLCLPWIGRSSAQNPSMSAMAILVNDQSESQRTPEDSFLFEAVFLRSPAVTSNLRGLHCNKQVLTRSFLAHLVAPTGSAKELSQ
jgi:hypothetical protein